MTWKVTVHIRVPGCDKTYTGRGSKGASEERTFEDEPTAKRYAQHRAETDAWCVKVEEVK